MQIVQVPIDDLKAADYNPRRMTEKQVADLTASLTEFGLVDPIVVNKHSSRMNVVVGGHQRLRIAKSMGFTHMPVVYVDLPLESERKLNLRLNRNNAEWDWEMLANNFSIEDLVEVGFDKTDLNVFDLKEDNFDTMPPHKDPVAKRGEVYVLGQHKIMCGDATEFEDVNKLMGGVDKARMLFTDPPYGVSYVENSNKGGEAGESKHTKIKNDDLKADHLQAFLYRCFKNAYLVTTEDAVFYSWFANSTYIEFRKAMEEAGWKYAQIIMWIKDRFVLSRSDYHHMCEPCMYGWKQGNAHFSNGKMRSFSDVISLDKDDFADNLDVWFVNRDATKDYEHPTQKPVRLAERALKMNTVNGDIVLDLFGGSGMTLIACEQSGRKARIMELDEKYVDLMLNRWSSLTGEDPIRQSDGLKWSEINPLAMESKKWGTVDA